MIRKLSSKAVAPLVWRAVAFLGVFVVYSGAMGPAIIGGGILNSDYFIVYAEIGKALLFAALAFLVLAWRRPPVTLPAQSRREMRALAVLSLAAYAGSYIAVMRLLRSSAGVLWIIAAHALLLTAVALAFAGCFGARNIRLLARQYRRELWAAAGAGAGFYLLLRAVYAAWHILASAVLHSVAWLLAASGLQVSVLPPYTLVLDKFGITVAQSCSGIESVALFTGLYIFVGLLDWPRLRRRRFVLVFFPALLGLFACNILRVYGLVMAGYFINPTIAFSLFHTYAGMIFFVLYSALFWGVSYRRLLHIPDITGTVA